jgi:hypothetical protein
MDWRKFEDGREAHEVFAALARKIRTSELDLGRQHYSLSLAVGVLTAIFCGYDRISAVEFGVGGGDGLLELCKAAQYFRDTFAIEIDVYGFDNATGLPPADGYRDHPELWRAGQFRLGDPDQLRAKLPPFAHLVIGDVRETTGVMAESLARSRLGFVSIDLDYYSSTMAALNVLKHEPGAYLPAIPMYFDDIHQRCLTINRWCGEALAIEEFNDENEFRKIEPKSAFRIQKFHVCHVLDHPIRSGAEPVRDHFGMMFLRAF